MTRCKSARAPRTPRTPRAMSPRRRISGIDEEERRVMRNNEKNRRPSTARLASARDPPRSAYSRNSSSILNRPAFTVYWEHLPVRSKEINLVLKPWNKKTVMDASVCNYSLMLFGNNGKFVRRKWLKIEYVFINFLFKIPLKVLV